MLPHDEDAKRLSKQTYSFVEFLTDRLDWEPPRLDVRAVVQGHCHHRAAEKTMKHDRELLDRLGLDYEILDTGCCGMAGSFGYHAGEHCALRPDDHGARRRAPATTEVYSPVCGIARWQRNRHHLANAGLSAGSCL